MKKPPRGSRAACIRDCGMILVGYLRSEPNAAARQRRAMPALLTHEFGYEPIHGMTMAVGCFERKQRLARSL